MESPCANGHEWDGCVCLRCGAEREHIYSPLEPCVCRRCGETRHEWDGCVCTRCGATRHDPDENCRCRRCGEEAHDWGTFWEEGIKKQSPHCLRCGLLRKD